MDSIFSLQIINGLNLVQGSTIEALIITHFAVQSSKKSIVFPSHVCSI